MAFAQSGTSPEEIRAAVALALSPERRRLAVTAAAKESLAAAEAAYRAEGGRRPTAGLFVDGRPIASLDRLDPDQGEVAFRFGRIAEVLAWIYAQLVAHSPVLTGRYAKAHLLLADGREADPAEPPPAERYVFVNVAPYARKIERGASRAAPNGVYQAVAVLADRRFGNTAHVGFGFESPVLDYIPGERGRGARARLRGQPLRVRAMRLERQTRLPAIVVVPA